MIARSLASTLRRECKSKVCRYLGERSERAPKKLMAQQPSRPAKVDDRIYTLPASVTSADQHIALDADFWATPPRDAPTCSLQRRIEAGGEVVSKVNGLWNNAVAARSYQTQNGDCTFCPESLCVPGGQLQCGISCRHSLMYEASCAQSILQQRLVLRRTSQNALPDLDRKPHTETPNPPPRRSS